jgi:hypothetical protein
MTFGEAGRRCELEALSGLLTSMKMRVRAKQCETWFSLMATDV